MPATTIVERRAMAIAEKHPEKLYARNRGLLKMSHQQLHDFAKTPEKGLPYRAKKAGASSGVHHLGRIFAGKK